MSEAVSQPAGGDVAPAVLGTALGLAAMGAPGRAVGPAAPTGRQDERGMVSAEWAVGIIAAVAIAGVLLAVVTNGKVESALLEFILSVIRGFAR
ncbi:MAG: hypothetical protein QOF52_1721 [Propionibacteriaceae bacterium]|jgi:hypothetical protein|nr:hypothetical protein [Propionibacteriaceae bacterium]